MSLAETLIQDIHGLPAADLDRVRELVHHLKSGARQRRQAAFAELRGSMSQAEAETFQQSIDEAFGKVEVTDEPVLD